MLSIVLAQSLEAIVCQMNRRIIFNVMSKVLTWSSKVSLFVKVNSPTEELEKRAAVQNISNMIRFKRFNLARNRPMIWG